MAWIQCLYLKLWIRLEPSWHKIESPTTKPKEPEQIVENIKYVTIIKEIITELPVVREVEVIKEKEVILEKIVVKQIEVPDNNRLSLIKLALIDGGVDSGSLDRTMNRVKEILKQ